MTTEEAKSILQPFEINGQSPQHWFDIGCGSGTFTRALAELLPEGSTITAVDSNAAAMRNMPGTHAGVCIRMLVGDVAQIDFRKADGVLMANVLHFLKDQKIMLTRLAKCADHIILVEYDTDQARPPWVPFPVSRLKAAELFNSAGFIEVMDLGRRDSSYGPEELYGISFKSVRIL
jgi:SAM-dependent methyltransferase